MKLEYIYSGKNLLAIVVRKNYKIHGQLFLSDPEWPLQIALIKRVSGEITARHLHPRFKRIIFDTMESQYILEGKLKVAIYNKHKKLQSNKILKAGDWIIFISGGHSFRFIGDTRIIEIRQGPYSKSKDKQKF